MHISNNSLDLEPVLANVARERNYHLVVIEFTTSESHPFWMLTSTWALLSRNQDILNSEAIRRAAKPPPVHPRQVPLWTDDFTSLYQILR